MSSSQTTTDGRRRQQVLCVLLCFCCWRGPVPVFHHHDFLDETQAVRESHAQVYHHDCDASCCHEWHWHLITPAAVPGDQNRGAYLAQDLLSLACTVHMLGDAGEQHLAEVSVCTTDSLCHSLADFAAPQRLSATCSTASFLSTLLPSARMVAVLGTSLI